MKLVDFKYAMVLEEMRNELIRPVITNRHSIEVDRIIDIISNRLIEEWLKKLILNDLAELKKTMAVGAFRSAIVCCGRCLEGVLKTIFTILESPKF